VENHTNEKAVALADESRTVASVKVREGALNVRFTQIRNYEIQIFGHYVPLRRHFCGWLQPGADRLSTDG